MRSARTGGPGAAWPRADVSERRRSRAGSRVDELLVPPVPQRDGGRRAAIPDPHRRRELRPRVAAEVHLLPGGQEARRAALRDLDLHLPEPLCHGPGGIPELERPPATPMLPALMSDVGAQQLAILIAELDGDVVPRGIDVGEACLGEDGDERQVPFIAPAGPGTMSAFFTCIAAVCAQQAGSS